MTRIDWSTPGSRFFEAGVDRGVLYVGDAPGVPWIGLTAVNQSRSGGDPKPRYIDGIKVSNHATPEEFEATIEALTYPTEFEQCDGTALFQNGLRATGQRRRSFGMAYRSRVGNDVDGLDHSYKIHILYNLLAQPTDRGYETLGDQNEAMSFSWSVTSRAELVIGLAPTAHFELDSRDVPADLMLAVENLLYGTEDDDPTLPTPGELVFLFDSYNDLVYDAGDPFTPVFSIHDAGSPSTAVTTTIDSGGV